MGSHYDEKVLHRFSGGDGATPYAGLPPGSGGGGNSGCLGDGCGTVYELTRASSGHALNVLWNFQSSSDGNDPDSTLLVGASGALYGTKTSGGGSSSSYDGTVFSVAP